MFKNTTLLLTALLLTAGSLTYHTSAQSRELPNSTYLHDTVNLKWKSRGSNKVMKVVDAETPSGQAIRVTTKKRNKKAWEVALWIEMDGAVNKGDQIEMHFWARTAKAPKSKETAELVIFVGRDEEPFDYILSEKFSPDNEWKSYTLKGTAEANFGGGKLKAEYQLGKLAQTVEFGGMTVSNLGPKKQ